MQDRADILRLSYVVQRGPQTDYKSSIICADGSLLPAAATGSWPRFGATSTSVASTFEPIFQYSPLSTSLDILAKSPFAASVVTNARSAGKSLGLFLPAPPNSPEDGVWLDETSPLWVYDLGEKTVMFNGFFATCSRIPGKS
jgi:hypothetical protein